MMDERKKAVVLLVPGFPADEQDTTCIPFLQQFCLAFLRVRPDIELRVLSFQYPYKKGYYVWNGIKVYCAGGRSRKYNRLQTWTNIFIQFLKIRRDYDIAVINSFWMSECAFIGQWFARMFKTTHVVYVIGQDALKSNRYLKLINFLKMKIIAGSESLVNKFYESTDFKIQHIIPMGINTDKIKSTHMERIIDILGVGSLIPLKNYLLFTELINELKKDFPGIKARIIGKGEQEQVLKEAIKTYGLQNNLELLGELSHNDVFSYMQRSKIFLHTSSYEGQSTVIMEALANGLNIVCFDVGRMHAKKKIWVCNSRDEILVTLKKLMGSSLTYEPVISGTSDDTVKEFFKVYENALPNINTGYSSNSFYNSAATGYNDKMNADPRNEKIRKTVADYFLSSVKGSYVLDFGGGTGNDLSWLMANNFDVCFCEPSDGMRAIAINNNKLEEKKIHFLNADQTDFRQWENNTFPRKFDAVLSNFGVINSIDDTSLLFRKLDDIIIPGGHIIATLIDTTYTRMHKSYRKNFLASFVKNRYPTVTIQHSGNKQTVYLHTPRRLRKAIPKSFNCVKIESLDGSGFMLLHYKKALTHVT